MKYIEHLYETIFESKEKYNRKLLNIPTPEFYVFYNGKETYPYDKPLKFPEAFIEKTGEPNLELNVSVININHPIIANCKTMQEYSVFVETVRRWKKADSQNGFQKAIEECIQNNILRDYPKRKTKEAINMLPAEYDYKPDIAVQRAEERETAFAEGVKEVLNKVLTKPKLETAKI